MKITIAGGGQVGNTIATELIKEKHDITIIDKNKAYIENVSNSMDAMPVLGDATSAQLLTDYGVEKSELMIAATDSDVVNLLICIIAKKLGIRNTISRIQDPIYSQTIALIKKDTGLSLIVNPERDAAKEIMRSLLFKDASQVETFAQGNNELITFVVREKNPIANMHIKDLPRFTGKKILICVIKRNNEVFIPNGDTAIQTGDTISFVSTRADAIQFFKKMKYEYGRISDVTIIGGGHLGFYIASAAVSNGIPVGIIEKDPSICTQLVEDIPEATVMCGDATNVDVLEECGVFRAGAVVLATDSDETNVVLSMYLKKQFPDLKVITKINKTDFEDMLTGINIGYTINPKLIAADRVIAYVRAMEETMENEVQSLCHVLDNKVEVMEFRVVEGMPHLNEKLQDIKFRKDVILASITRRGESFIPGGSDMLESGDTVLVVTTKKGIGQFRELFE